MSEGDSHFSHAIVDLNIKDDDFVALGPISLSSTIKEVAERVLAKKNVDGLNYCLLGYARPHEEVVLLPAETLLADAKLAIIKVSN